MSFLDPNCLHSGAVTWPPVWTRPSFFSSLFNKGFYYLFCSTWYRAMHQPNLPLCTCDVSMNVCRTTFFMRMYLWLVCTENVNITFSHAFLLSVFTIVHFHSAAKQLAIFSFKVSFPNKNLFILLYEISIYRVFNSMLITEFVLSHVYICLNVLPLCHHGKTF